jgi:hypothetical protein
MDARLEKALEFSNYMVTLGNQKRVLKEQFQNNLIHYHDGSQFTVTTGLISFCQSLLALQQSSTILIDDNDIPTEVEDLQLFANKIVSVYWQAANTYLTEYNKLKRNRTVEGIVDL